METGWVTLTIADEGTVSSAGDLGMSYDQLLINVPTLDAATLAVHVCDTLTGTYAPLYVCNVDGTEEAILAGAGTGGFFWTVPFGFQYVKVVAGAAQNGGPRSIKVKGTRTG